MEKIVQLRESEYDRLVKQANMTAEEIKHTVSKEVADHCNLEVILTMDTRHPNGQFDSKFSIKPVVKVRPGFYPADNSGKYVVSLRACDKIGNKIQAWLKDQVQEIYGSWFDEVEHYKKMVRDQWKWRTILTMLAMSGWAVAAVILCMK